MSVDAAADYSEWNFLVFTQSGPYFTVPTSVLVWLYDVVERRVSATKQDVRGVCRPIPDRIPAEMGSRVAHIACSVRGPQNLPHLRVLEHVLPQQMIMPGTFPAEPAAGKRQMGIRIEA